MVLLNLVLSFFIENDIISKPDPSPFVNLHGKLQVPHQCPVLSFCFLYHQCLFLLIYWV
uniref:Uncharacterized protein n=1 Tax=Rhizophora mucronata TaxID=61149 RepID=A0A2P2NRH3_RHIMU